MDGVALQVSVIAVLTPVLVTAGILGLVRLRPGGGRAGRSAPRKKAPGRRPAVPTGKRGTPTAGVKEGRTPEGVTEQGRAALPAPTTPKEAAEQARPPSPSESLEVDPTDPVLQMDDFIARQRERLRVKELFEPLTGEEAARLYPETEADRALMEEMLRAMMGDESDGVPDSPKPETALVEGPAVWWSQAV